MQEGIGQNNKYLFAKLAPQLATELLNKYPATDLRDDDTKYNNQTTAIAIAGDFKVKALEPQLKAFFEQGHKVGQNLRSNALRALMKIDMANASIGGEILENDSVIDFRMRIANAMGEFPGKQVNSILNDLKAIPLGLQEPVAIALCGSSEGKDILLSKVTRGEILPRTLVQPRVSEAFNQSVNKSQGEKFNALTATSSCQRGETGSYRQASRFVRGT